MLKPSMIDTVLLPWLAATILFVTDSSALDREERLAEIQQAVGKYSVELELLDDEQRAIRGEIRDLDAESKEIERQRERLEKQYAKVVKEYDSLDANFLQISDELNEVSTVSEERLRSLYMHRREGVLDRLVLVGGGSARDLYLLSRLQRHDQQMMHRLENLQINHRSKLAELERKLKERDEAYKKLESEQLKLVATKDQKRDRLTKLALHRKRTEEALAELRAQALHLETVVAALTSGAEEPRAAVTIDRIPKESIQPEVELPFEGRGLFHLKGELQLPVEGKVVQTFGKHQHSKFADFIFSKGLEVLGEVGGSVRAIADGRVAYLGRMPGYGTIIILDHGQRYYSLYGRLTATEVVQGQVVKGGVGIAYIGVPDDRERNFYFEIRKSGTSIDPKPYFGKKLG